jgi:hypothetical protein
MFNLKRDRNPWGRVNRGKSLGKRFLKPLNSEQYGVADNEGKIVGGPFYCKRDAKAERNRLNGSSDGGKYRVCPYK